MAFGRSLQASKGAPDSDLKSGASPSELPLLYARTPPV